MIIEVLFSVYCVPCNSSTGF